MKRGYKLFKNVLKAFSRTNFKLTQTYKRFTSANLFLFWSPKHFVTARVKVSSAFANFISQRLWKLWSDNNVGRCSIVRVREGRGACEGLLPLAKRKRSPQEVLRRPKPGKDYFFIKMLKQKKRLTLFRPLKSFQLSFTYYIIL